MTQDDIDKARTDSRTGPAYSVRHPKIAMAGGERPILTNDPSCPKGCQGFGSGRWLDVWVDSTNFIPDPWCEEQFPEFCSGTCELRSTLYEMMFCRSEKFPPDPCPTHYRVIGSWVIAVKSVSGQVGCQTQYFRPFHRIGSIDPLSMNENEEFAESGLGGRRTYNVGYGFTGNFKISDMSIKGSDWLTLSDGWLVGKPPRTGKEEEYAFSIKARNRAGTSDPVDLIVKVSP